MNEWRVSCEVLIPPDNEIDESRWDSEPEIYYDEKKAAESFFSWRRMAASYPKNFRNPTIEVREVTPWQPATVWMVRPENGEASGESKAQPVRKGS